MRKMHVLWAASKAVLRRWLTNLNAFIREEDTLQYRCLFFKKTENQSSIFSPSWDSKGLQLTIPQRHVEISDHFQ